MISVLYKTKVRKLVILSIMLCNGFFFIIEQLSFLETVPNLVRGRPLRSFKKKLMDFLCKLYAKYYTETELQILKIIFLIFYFHFASCVEIIIFR